MKTDEILFRLAGLNLESVSDGPGLRMTIYLQGCPHHCPGCHNPETWALDGGESMTTADFLNQLSPSPLISGITLSGGEPFHQAAAAGEIARWARSRGYSVWTYTGYHWEQLLASPDQAVQRLLRSSEVIVDGPFRADQRDLSLAFRGSRNQRLIDTAASLNDGTVVEWQPDD
jgi:anaerobic ribonucleoside-triphosphate reductase activating protein